MRADLAAGDDADRLYDVTGNAATAQESAVRGELIEGVIEAIGRTGKSSGKAVGEGPTFNLPIFLRAKNLKPFITQDLMEASAPIKFRPVIDPARGGANLAYGFKADLLPLICQVFLDAAMEGKLSNKQVA